MSTEIVKTGGALAIRPDQTDWTPDQAAVLQQSGISNAVTKAELSGFLHLCQRTGLDPFSRQIYLIGRYSKKEGRDVFTPQTGIDGYRVIAQRVTSQTGGTYGYEDTVWCDPSGKWRDVWLPEAPPAAAKVTVIRNGQRFSAVATFREYVQAFPDGNPKGLWAKMPAGQIAKCAEALALRKAFPHDLAGVYTAEEMAQADNPAPERHLRTVQQSESDPWATTTTAVPDPNSVAVKGRSQPAQDFAYSAAEAADRDAVKDIYRQANEAGLLAETVKIDRELLELGKYLIARGQELAEAKPKSDAEIAADTAQARQEMYQAAEAAGLTARDADQRFKSDYDADSVYGTAEQLRAVAASFADTGPVVEGEVVETGPAPHSMTDADAAERDLREAAAKAGLTNLDEEFEKSFGLPIAQAGAQQMREMTALLTGTAA